MALRSRLPGNEARSDHDSAAALQSKAFQLAERKEHAPESANTPCDADRSMDHDDNSVTVGL
jgi:hypothetical protein